MEPKTILKCALFAAFIVCLYVSIPHLAWTFHSWESGPEDTPLSVSILGFSLLSTSSEWLNAYLQAMSIDVIIALLSITLTNSKRKTQMGMGYTFVGLLIGISWLFNWMYAKAHAPTSGGIWTHAEFWGLIHLDTLTPIITSALPVFALAFTVMIDKLTGEKMTAEQLAQEATELEALSIQQRRIAEIKRSNNINGATALIDAGVNIFGHIGNTVKKPSKTVVTPNQMDVNIQSDEPSIDGVTPNQSEANTQSDNGSKSGVTPDQSGESNDSKSGVTHTQSASNKASDDPSKKDIGQSNNASDKPSENGSKSHSKASPNGSTSRLFVPLDEAVNLLQYDLQYVKVLRTKGVLRTHPKNPDLITIASINAVNAKKQSASKNTTKEVSATAPMPSDEKVIEGTKEVSDSASIPSNESAIESPKKESATTPTPTSESVIEADKEESGDDANKLDIALVELRNNPSITDEELAKLLKCKRPASARFWRLKAGELLSKEKITDPSLPIV